MILIGITGVIGSGKTTVSSMLAKHGYKVIDLDKIAKQSLDKREIKEKIAKMFGCDVLKEGRLDIEMLRNMVFKDERNVEKLESIVHPEIAQKTKMQIERFKHMGEKALIIDGPLIFEKGMYKELDKNVVVSTSRDMIYERLKRRGMDREDIDRRLGLQMPLEEKERLADYVIRNDGDIERLEKEVMKFIECIKRWEGEAYASK